MTGTTPWMAESAGLVSDIVRHADEAPYSQDLDL